MGKTSGKNLRIAILVRMFPNIVQTYVLNHVLSMKAAGLHTSVIAESQNDQDMVQPAVREHNLVDDTIYINAETDHLVEQFTLLPITNTRYLKALFKILLSDLWFQYGVKYTLKSLVRARTLAVDNFDVIHSHSLFCSYDYLFLREIFSIPLITTFHGLVPNNVQMLEPGKIRKVLKTGDIFLVNTRFAYEQLMSLSCPATKIKIIPQGTDTKEFPYRERSITPDSKIVLLSVGRLSVEKGFHIAIRAVSDLSRQFPNIEYRIVGNGIEKQNLLELIRSLGAQNSIKLCGFVTTDKLREHYQDAHIFILPSIDLKDGTHTETQGVVLQEAQASGIPVIASRTGGIPEVVQDQLTGLLFDEGDNLTLARLIALLINDSNLYEKIRNQALNDVNDNYAIDVIRDQLLSVYLTVTVGT